MASDLHLPHAFPLGETEFATGSLFRLLKNALGDPDLAGEVTAAIERIIDAKIASSRERERDRRPMMSEI